jgi:hypothetical protein
MKLIYVDSKFRVPGGTTTDFKIALRETIHVPDGSLMRVDQIRFPVVFYTVSADNCYLYLLTGTNVGSRVRLEVGGYDGYTLAAHIRERCALATGGSWQAAYTAATGSITVTSPMPVQFLTDAVVLQAPPSLWGPTWSAADLKSFNANLGDFIASGLTTTFSYVSLRPVDTFYLCSRMLSSPDCYGPRHNHDVLAKIVLGNEVFGETHKSDMPTNLYHTLRERTLRELDFQLTNRQGEPVTS